MMMMRWISGVFFLLMIYTNIYSREVTPPPAPTQPAPMQPGKPGQTPAGTDDAQLLEAMMQEINGYVNSLAPEEQEEFWKAVEEESKKIEKMSPDQLEQYINDTFSGAPGEEPNYPAEIPYEQPVVVDRGTPTPRLEIEVAPQDASIGVISLIDTILDHIQRLLNKLAIVPEMPGKIEKWLQEGRINYAQEFSTWNELRTRIESLQTKLAQLKEEDPQLKRYRFIPELIKNESLVNMLNKLKATLIMREPSIEVSPFGLDKMSKKSTEEIIAALSDFAELFTQAHIIESINNVLKTFEPIAAQIRQEEEAAAKKALEESKKTRKRSPTKRAGGKESIEFEEGEFGRAPESGKFGFEEYPSFDFDRGSRRGTPEEEGREGKKTVTAGGAGAKGEAGAGGKGGGSAPKAGGEPKKPEEKKKEIPDDKDPAVKSANRKLDSIRSLVNEIADGLAMNLAASNLEKHLTESGDANAELFSLLAKGKPKLDLAVKRIDALIKQKNLPARDYYMQELRELATEHKDTFDDFIKQVKNANSKQLQSKASEDKKNKYFESGHSLNDLAETIQTLYKALPK